MTVTCHVRFCSRVGRGDFLHLDNWKKDSRRVNKSRGRNKPGKYIRI
ncbi:hypothetical protein RYE99_04050 [Wolbachia endosymbiont of Drosophila seguyi]|nr:hypothetical protein [Wolbachia endosymbiont of Drosophila seguyi]